MTTIKEKWRQAEKLCDTKEWHCHLHAVPPVPTTPQTGVLQQGPKGLCGVDVLKHSSMSFQTSSYGKFTIHRSLFLPLSTTSSGFKFSLVVHPQLFPQTPHSPFSDEWVARTHCPSGKHQELRKWAAGITQDLSKRKSEGQTSSLFFSRMDETGDYSDSSSSLSILWWLVAPQQQCLATGTQQARKSKQKPPLPPQGQIWQEKQH